MLQNLTFAALLLLAVIVWLATLTLGRIDRRLRRLEQQLMPPACQIGDDFDEVIHFQERAGHARR